MWAQTGVQHLQKSSGTQWPQCRVLLQLIPRPPRRGPGPWSLGSRVGVPEVPLLHPSVRCHAGRSAIASGHQALAFCSSAVPLSRAIRPLGCFLHPALPFAVICEVLPGLPSAIAKSGQRHTSLKIKLFGKTLTISQVERRGTRATHPPKPALSYSLRDSGKRK